MGKFAVQQFLLLALPLLHLAAPPANAAAIDALRSAAAAAGHSLDAWCMAYSCPGQSYACAVNSDCRACLTCLHSCGGSGDTCSAACLYRCRAEQLLTDFLTCAVTEHNCVELSPPAAADGVKDWDEDQDECRPEQLQAWGPQPLWPKPMACGWPSAAATRSTTVIRAAASCWRPRPARPPAASYSKARQ
ncbi:hypothetical protein BOX15_Mlig021800g1 [Macrostomum lignano]|uniref:VDE lipocalin domain-containing protein n=1 Tax=Macrostomum lignano TaxID=282301 RepID=A0A267H371_9PLAT|nr:hypothetical protein BOX15_Mlig021800g1 [Macrostomum lignano]